MATPAIVSHDQWLAARRQLLEEEKAFTRRRDALTAQRQALPWERVEKSYEFDSADGRQTLSDLFGKASQLIVYHFMFDPEWDEGCKSCSLIADLYEPAVEHLAHRDVALVTVSRAPLDKLELFRQRMGWNFKWVSSFGSDFNYDYHVSFTPQEMDGGQQHYNYRDGAEFPAAEAPGASVFAKNEAGEIFHTYSAYARGLEAFMTVYNWLDIVPRGRDEDDLPYGMFWVRHHDRYDDPTFEDPYA